MPYGDPLVLSHDGAASDRLESLRRDRGARRARKTTASARDDE